MRSMLLTLFFLWSVTQSSGDEQKPELKEIPDKLVVLTFDDSARSHFTVVRPVLLQYGFNATFFITEGFDFRDNKKDYMTRDQIAQLHREGFEIGNHTQDHLGITDATVDRLEQQLKGIEKACARHGIPRPVTFAWPGNATTSKAFDILTEHGIRFARRGELPSIHIPRGWGLRTNPGRTTLFCCPPPGMPDLPGNCLT
ncbi:MAG: polysaccharide deacetylase family protein [Planctomycetota bacterium]|nr:polysaccharide deacetylase family protein [Planctomycetota bacterium]